MTPAVLYKSSSMCADDLRSEALCHQPGSDTAQAHGPVQSACPVGSQRWSPHSESPEGKITAQHHGCLTGNGGSLGPGSGRCQ